MDEPRTVIDVLGRGAVIMLFACAWGVMLVVRHRQRLGLGTSEAGGVEPGER